MEASALSRTARCVSVSSHPFIANPHELRLPPVPWPLGSLLLSWTDRNWDSGRAAPAMLKNALRFYRWCEVCSEIER